MLKTEIKIVVAVDGVNLAKMSKPQNADWYSLWHFKFRYIARVVARKKLKKYLDQMDFMECVVVSVTSKKSANVYQKKLPKLDFTRKNNNFDTFTKIA